MPEVTQADAGMNAYLDGMPRESVNKDVTFGARIRAGRQALGLSQDDLVDEATLLMRQEDPDSPGVSRSTIARWERGDGGRYDPDQVRAVFRALNIDVREALVLLGYATREELDLPADPPPVFTGGTLEAIEMLEDPDVPDETKQQLISYLRFLNQQRGAVPKTANRRRPAG